MIIYNLFTAIIKLFSLGVFLTLLALTAYLIWAGADMFLATGELWAAYDSESLQLGQVIIERYLYYPLWEHFVVPYILLQPAYAVLPVGVLGSGFITFFILKL